MLYTVFFISIRKFDLSLIDAYNLVQSIFIEISDLWRLF